MCNKNISSIKRSLKAIIVIGVVLVTVLIIDFAMNRQDTAKTATIQNSVASPEIESDITETTSNLHLFCILLM